MISGLYSALSGLLNFSKKTEITANNVANANTPGFKSSRASLESGPSQNTSSAAGSSQVGRGVQMGSVNQNFAQGTFESSFNPTDLAIGGQGFFVLRQPDSQEADRFTRSGGFTFNQNGNLTNATGHYVQGWTLDPNTGEPMGSIGDINLGASTPPVATSQIDMIFNVDSRTPLETNEVTLFDAWDGRNAAAATPTTPIDQSNFEYATSTRIYDDQGASHDVTVYFDRTTNPNQWEFLVTTNPLEDQRNIDPSQQAAYAPLDQYSASDHKGAGALMYGTIDFNSAGQIQSIAAYDVPPDGTVDPALNDNRIVLGSTDTTYSFLYNSTGDSVNQSVELNFGARFSGQLTNQSQIITSATGSVDSNQNPITAITTFDNVYDTNGNVLATGDTLAFNGFNHDGVAASLNYVVDGSNTVQDMLDQLGTAFNGTASIDPSGRIRVADNTGGDSNMFIDSITTTAASGSDPFGNSATMSQQGDTVSTRFQPEELASTQYANSSNTIFQSSDGFAAGFLQSISTDTNGVITGRYSNGQIIPRAQVALANFNNMAGLSMEGGNLFRATTESGAPITGAPGTVGLGTIAPNALEMSNVELARELPDMMLTKRYFQANLKIIEAEDEMLGNLIDTKS